MYTVIAYIVHGSKNGLFYDFNLLWSIELSMSMSDISTLQLHVLTQISAGYTKVLARESNCHKRKVKKAIYIYIYIYIYISNRDPLP